jgi:uncharacterized membrane protein
MSLPVAAALFTLYSLAGWVLDSAWRSVADRKLERGGFSSLPLCPVYGVGAFLAIGVDAFAHGLPLFAEALVIGFALTLLEYVTGVLGLKVFGRRLWEYKGTVLNVGGHTDLFHFAAWSVLGLLMVRVLDPWLLSLLS